MQDALNHHCLRCLPPLTSFAGVSYIFVFSQCTVFRSRKFHGRSSQRSLHSDQPMQAFGLDADRSGLEPLAAMGVGLQGFRVWGLRSCRLDVSIRVMSGYSSIGPRFGV